MAAPRRATTLWSLPRCAWRRNQPLALPAAPIRPSAMESAATLRPACVQAATDITISVHRIRITYLVTKNMEWILKLVKLVKMVLQVVTLGAVAPGVALFPQKRGPPPWATR